MLNTNQIQSFQMSMENFMKEIHADNAEVSLHFENGENMSILFRKPRQQVFRTDEKPDESDDPTAESAAE